MCAEYLIHVPEEYEQWFEGLPNVKIQTKRLTFEENRAQARELWNKQAPKARGLIAEFKKEHDPETEENIKEGILSLMGAVFYYYSPDRFKTLTEVDINTLKSALVSFFEFSTPEDLPENVSFLPSPKPSLTRKWSTKPHLLPLHTILIIEKYGLADGQLKTTNSVCKKYRFSVATIDQLIRRNPIRQDPQIRKILLK